MAAARPWEQFLLEEHSVLAVSPWRRLQLFDVLAKGSSSGGAPNVRKIGTFFDLCVGVGAGEDEDEDDDVDLEVINNLKEALHKFNRRRHDADEEPSDDEGEPCITREGMCDLMTTAKAGSKTLASVLKFANVKHSSSDELRLTVEGVFLHSIDTEGLIKVIRKAWKPDMETLKLHNVSPSGNWPMTKVFDLWLITDVLYGNEIIVESNTSRSSGAGVQAPGDLLCAVGVPAPSVGLSIGNERSGDTVKELRGGNIQFAIRTIRLRYKADGKLNKIDTEVKALKVRAGSTDDELVDPVSDPIFNMGDFFLNVPKTSAEDSYIPLEIVVGDAAESAHELESD